MNKRLISFFIAGLLFQLYGFAQTNRDLAGSKYRDNVQPGFTENKGQFADNNHQPVPFVLYNITTAQGDVWITETGITYVFKKAVNQREDEQGDIVYDVNWSRVDLSLEHSKIKRSKVREEKQLPGTSNYYLGHCPDGILDVKTFQKITIADVYPDIDWVLEVKEEGLKYDFVIHPGGDASKIVMNYKWADTHLNNGTLLVTSTNGQLEETAPYAYMANSKKEIAAAFVLENTEEKNSSKVRFQIGTYDKSEKLVIDPLQILWATAYGSTGMDRAQAIATSYTGNAYVTGYTLSGGFPTYNPGGGAYFDGTLNAVGCSEDIFILGFDNDGIRLWATFYGGNCDDRGNGINVDDAGNIYVTGTQYHSASSFPVMNPGGGAYFQTGSASGADAILLRFNSSGARTWATVYGEAIGGNDYGHAVTTDHSGNVYIVGYTLATTLPMAPLAPAGGYASGYPGSTGSIFIAGFNPAGVIFWATYLGSATAASFGNDIHAAENGNIFVAGNTRGSGMPVVSLSGAYNDATFNGGTGSGYGDGYIARFNSANKALAWATYFGGTGDDTAEELASDRAGSIYVVGNTNSPSAGFPFLNWAGAYNDPTPNGSTDAFISCFSNIGVQVWTTYYGGSGAEGAISVATDKCSGIYVCGGTTTTGTGFPTQNLAGAYNQAAQAGSKNGFIVRFNLSGVRQWATLYGGTASDELFSVDVDLSGNPWFAGSSLSTSISLPNTTGGYAQAHNGSPGNALVAKFEAPSAVGVMNWNVSTMNSNKEDNGNDIAYDSEGNIYVAGQFDISTTFPHPLCNVTINGSGFTPKSAYIAKYSACGELLWVNYENGLGWTDGSTLVVDDLFGDVYIAGPGSGVVNFQATAAVPCGPAPTAGASFTVNTYYIARFSKSSGAYLDSYLAPVSPIVTNTEIFSMALRKVFSGWPLTISNAIYLTGSQNNSSTAAREVIFDRVNRASGVYSPGFAKTSTMPIAGTNARGYDLVYNQSQTRVYITGDFQQSLSFDNGSGNTTITNAGAFQDGFIAAFNANTGNVIPASFYACGAAAGELAGGTAIVSTETTNVIATGFYTGNLASAYSFGGLPGTSGLYSTYIISTDGTVGNWLNNIFAGSGNAIATGISQYNGQLVLCGQFFNGNLNFATNNAYVSSAAGERRLYVASADATTGNLLDCNVSESLISGSQHLSSRIVNFAGYAYTTGGYVKEMDYALSNAPSGPIFATPSGFGNTFILRSSVFADMGFRQHEQGTNDIIAMAGASSNVNIYPVPASDLITVQLHQEIEQAVTVELYTTTGQLIERRVITRGNTQAQIDLSGLDAGIYLVKVVDSGSAVVKQIVKM
ncbi:MAG: hypothetical protein FD123_2476 [Bacteroidetes bacterium]|nr:MAG: hypothetical protein FD123_2476 [Bacteroidota bacterium]